MTGQDGAPCEHDVAQEPVQVLMQRVHAAMPAIGKTHEAPKDMGGFAFRGIEDILAALNPLLGEYGVFYVPEVSEYQRDDSGRTQNNKVQQRVTLRVTLRFYGPAKDTISISAMGEATDTGDKATPKATTNGIKNALLAWLALPTEETAASDTDRNTSEEIVDHDAQQKDSAIALGYADHAERVRMVENVVEQLTAVKAKGLAKDDLDRWTAEYGNRRNALLLISRDKLVESAEVLASWAAQLDEDGGEDAPTHRVDDDGRVQPLTPEEKPEAERAGVQPEQVESGKGYDGWTVKELDDWLRLMGIEDVPKRAKREDKITRLREHDVARKAKGEIPETWVEPDEVPFT